MSLPLRFKAGGSGGQTSMAPTIPSSFHHRSTTKFDHKPFKSRFASKSALKDKTKGKVEEHRDERGKRRTPHQQAMSRLARRNQAKQLRIHHNDKTESESNIFQGPSGAAKHVAVVPLSPGVDTRNAIKILNESVDVLEPVAESGVTRVKVDRFRRNLLYMPANTATLTVLDICRLADWIVLVISANQNFGEDQDQLLRAMEGQGITNVVAIVENLDKTVPAPKRSKHLSDLRAALSRYFPTIDKVSVLDSKPDCSNLIRTLCTARTKGIRWRDERSWVRIDDTRWHSPEEFATSSDVTLTGTIRGKSLNVDRLVHVPGWGDFQIRRIVEVPTQVHKRKVDEMVADINPRDWLPTPEQEDLAELAPETVMNDATSTMATSEHKGVLLDNHHYFSDDESHIPAAPKKLPQGTSSYQAAWYLDDISDSESDMIDDEDDQDDIEIDEATPLRPEDGEVANGVNAMTDVGPSEYPESEMHIDANDEEEALELAQFRESRKQEAEEDLEFPDEIELHPNVLARERLVKYRGLKSLRTSEWNTAEDMPNEPTDYKRLLQVADYKRSKNSVLKEALGGGALAGTRVEIQLREVPLSLQAGPPPSALFSLLRHEHKHTVVNLNMTLHSAIDEPLRSKEEVIVQIGHRRLVINPVFSAAGVTPNDVHKFDRFLHPGRTAIATFTGPMTWGSVPGLVFKRVQSSEEIAPAMIDAMNTDQQGSNFSNLKLIGTATTVPPSHSRVIAKRVILTGHPFKIHKKLVTVRYIFFNREDVSWFAALPLWTKRGRQGFIKESLGTHGYFKATFDGKINPMDAVGVSLYKRVWPRPARPWVQ